MRGKETERERVKEKEREGRREKERGREKKEKERQGGVGEIGDEERQRLNTCLSTDLTK